MAAVAGALLTQRGAPAAAQAGGAAPAAALDRPNIVLVLTDDQTVESLDKMPYVGGRSDWIRFDQAHAQNATCCPSRATLLQGRDDTRTRVTTDLQGAQFAEAETLPVWLDRAGYRTGLFGTSTATRSTGPCTRRRAGTRGRRRTARASSSSTTGSSTPTGRPCGTAASPATTSSPC